MLGERIVRRHFGRLPWLLRYLLGKAAIGGVNAVVDRHYEYAFTVRCLTALEIRDKDVLEVGCCGSYLPLVMAAMGNRVVGVDLYPWDIRYPGVKMITGSILDLDLERRFDVAVAISVIEHIGLSRYARASERLDRDAVAAIRSLLREEGYFVVSVPYGRNRTFRKYHRVYDEESFSQLTKGFVTIQQEFFAPTGKNQNLEPCSESDTHRFGRRALPYAITCALLRRSP